MIRDEEDGISVFNWIWSLKKNF